MLPTPPPTGEPPTPTAISPEAPEPTPPPTPVVPDEEAGFPAWLMIVIIIGAVIVVIGVIIIVRARMQR